MRLDVGGFHQRSKLASPAGLGRREYAIKSARRPGLLPDANQSPPRGMPASVTRAFTRRVQVRRVIDAFKIVTALDAGSAQRCAFQRQSSKPASRIAETLRSVCECGNCRREWPSMAKGWKASLQGAGGFIPIGRAASSAGGLLIQKVHRPSCARGAL